MNLRDIEIPDEVDEVLREWACFFRDYRARERCKSLEGRYTPHSDDFSDEGWGDPETTVKPAPRPRDWVLRAMRTQDILTKIAKAKEGKKYVWAITYHYAYPGLPKFVVLRLMKKYVGRHLNWKQYLDILDVGRMRVWTTAFSERSA